MPSKVWDERTYPFPNFNDYTVEVWERISNSIPHLIMDVITYPCYTMLVKGDPNFLSSDGLFEVVTYGPRASLKVTAFSGPLPQPELDPDVIWVLTVPGGYAVQDSVYTMASDSAYVYPIWNHR